MQQPPLTLTPTALSVQAVLPALLDAQRPCTFAPYYEYTQALDARVREIGVRIKREIFAAMRQASVTPDTFLPKLGITMGEFTVWQVLLENPRLASARATASPALSSVSTPSFDDASVE
jgi:hypothetical protein